MPKHITRYNICLAFTVSSCKQPFYYAPLRRRHCGTFKRMVEHHHRTGERVTNRLGSHRKPFVPSLKRPSESSTQPQLSQLFRSTQRVLSSITSSKPSSVTRHWVVSYWRAAYDPSIPSFAEGLASSGNGAPHRA